MGLRGRSPTVWIDTNNIKHSELKELFHQYLPSVADISVHCTWNRRLGQLKVIRNALDLCTGLCGGLAPESVCYEVTSEQPIVYSCRL